MVVLPTIHLNWLLCLEFQVCYVPGFTQDIHPFKNWLALEFFFMMSFTTGWLVPARPGRWDISAKRKSSLAQAQAPSPSANIAQVVRKKGLVISANLTLAQK